MQESLSLHLPVEDLKSFCRRWEVAEMALFGSALRSDFGPQSDLDFLVSFEPSAHHSLFDLVQMEEELEAITGRKVDLVTRRAIEHSANYIRREAILSTARPVFDVI